MKAAPALKMAIRPARETDAAPIAALLRDASLPHDDFAPHLANFLVARAGDEVVGAVGLEVQGAAALLRSLVVAPELRGQGLGDSLTETVVARARPLGVRRIYLLTTTADKFFARRGFTVIARSNVPAGIAATEEFRSLCPATAACMVRIFSP
jgi:amino-acid N-acetyltransferase